MEPTHTPDPGTSSGNNPGISGDNCVDEPSTPLSPRDRAAEGTAGTETSPHSAATTARPQIRSMAEFIAYGFGSGLVPKAPGTVASVLGAILHWWLLSQLSIEIQISIIVGAFGLGVVVSNQVERKLGHHDHGAIVWDEFVGVWIALLASGGTVWGTVLGFALFRLFDIAKPWPISVLDRRVGGGLGVMIDDVAAGIVAALLLFTALSWYPS
jgi:phosphatidylglycerophosphatase A